MFSQSKQIMSLLYHRSFDTEVLSQGLTIKSQYENMKIKILKMTTKFHP
jgi:hypothetical protein